MLPVQVQYWTYVEAKRHNLINEDQGQQQINEIVRHNMKTESQTDWYNSEMQRHNYASEAIGRTQAAASMLGAQAAMSSAGAAWKNAKTNAYLAKPTAKQTQANTKLLKSKSTYTESETVRGWFNTGASYISAVNK